MLSLESPPPDLSSLTSTITTPTTAVDIDDSHERVASLGKQIVSPAEIDQHSSTHFSIRGYVFAARSKDIATSWPFSRKHLQLCLKNGVKDLLPPFQCVDYLRNRSACRRFLVERAVKNVSNLEEKPSAVSNGFVSSDSSMNSGCNHKLPEAGHADLNPSSGGGGKEQESEVEQASNSKQLPNLLEASDGVEVAAPAAGTIQASSSVSKKCKLVVKSGTNAAHKSSTTGEIIATASEALMASKVCPVCQTFSSPSNTTLNAHIDQCLSIKSPSEWPESCKLAKPRIKPRKMRLMSDIYATAPRCTLQDLQRRNGTKWAVEMNLGVQVTSAASQGKNQMASSTSIQDVGNDDGAVYVDANGTKMRILSRSIDVSSVLTAGDDHPKQPKNPPKKCKGARFFSSIKKKRLAKHKYLKLTPHISPLKAPPPQVTGALASHKEGGQLAPLFKAREQKKPSDSGIPRKLDFSKTSTSVLLKGSKGKSSHRYSKHKMQAEKDLLAESDRAGGSHAIRYSSLPEKCMSWAKIGSRNSGSSHRAGFIHKDCSLSRKRLGGPLVRDPIHNNAEMQPSARDTGHFNGDHASMTELEAVNVNVRAMETMNMFPNSSRPSSQNFHAFSSKGTRLIPNLKGKLCLPSQVSPAACQFNTKQKGLLALKERRMIGIGKDLGARPAGVLQRSDSRQYYNEEDDRPKTGEISEQPQRGLASIYLGSSSHATTSDVPRSDLRCHGQDEVGNISFYNGVNSVQTCTESVLEVPYDGEVIAIDHPSSKLASNLGRSSAHKLADANGLPFNSLQGQGDEEYQGCLFRAGASIPLMEPSSGNECGVFCVDEIGVGTIDPAEGTDTGYISKLAIAHASSFLMVDSIPIPGPPGSYLPSPRDMESEVMQGNSSLTTSCIQCAHDPWEVADEDSSDSPISAVSTVSNLMEAKSMPNFSRSSIEPSTVQGKACSGFSSLSARDAVEKALMFQQVASTGHERVVSNAAGLQGGVVSRDKGAFSSLRSNNQLCCCSRKGGIPWDTCLSFQGSQLLKQQSLTSLTLPAMGKNRSELSTAPNYLKTRTEMSSLTLTECSRTASERLAHSSAAATMPQAATPTEIVASASNDSLSPASTLVLRLMGKNLMVSNNIVENSHASDQPTLNTRDLTFPRGSRPSQASHCLRDNSSLVHAGACCCDGNGA
ncbi:hypothetical protein Nepgr_007737 [Nepenthes gracilis]|uniref:UBZ4-type domain-containing protein n=1 Tax=Nepenthes gracilis TaxID=150966 RepID=A0AAD3S8B4_NEPGR|nr:hypothetical protein Nepgr_007737 [Nepenthes gracilis]